LLERTLSYYCRQSIAKFDIKTGVMVYELVKQLSLIMWRIYVINLRENIQSNQT